MARVKNTKKQRLATKLGHRVRQMVVKSGYKAPVKTSRIKTAVKAAKTRCKKGTNKICLTSGCSRSLYVGRQFRKSQRRSASPEN